MVAGDRDNFRDVEVACKLDKIGGGEVDHYDFLNRNPSERHAAGIKVGADMILFRFKNS